VSATLAAALERCLAKLPAQRFENAEAFANAIAPVVGQRAEIPPLLRNWITRGEMTLPVLALWMLPVAAIPNAEMLTIANVASGSALAQRVLALIIGGVPACTVALLVRLWDLRQVSRAGFTLQDVRFGTLVYAMQRSEELLAQRQQASPAQRSLRVVAIGLAGLTGLTVMYALLTMPMQSTLFALGALPTIMLAFSYAVVASGRWNRVRHYRSVMWNSAAGAFLFRLAGLARTPRARRNRSSTHEPREARPT
jgi:hypothetical protein